MLGCKGLKKVSPENVTKRVVYGSKPTFRSGIPRAYNFCFSLLFCLQFLLLSRTTTQVIIWYDPQVLLQSASTLFSSDNKDVWDVVQRVIIIASVSEQVCTYPSPWPKNSQLITSACYCWARGRVGAQLRRSWHWSELFLLFFYFFFLQVIHGRFIAGFYFIMLSNWPVKLVPFQPFALLETEANSEFLTVIIILVRKASFY